jgi:hypothetical protein
MPGIRPSLFASPPAGLSARVIVVSPELQTPESRSRAVPLGETRTIATLFRPPPVTSRLLRFTVMELTVPERPDTTVEDPSEAPTVLLTVIEGPEKVCAEAGVANIAKNRAAKAAKPSNALPRRTTTVRRAASALISRARIAATYCRVRSETVGDTRSTPISAKEVMRSSPST